MSKCLESRHKQLTFLWIWECDSLAKLSRKSTRKMMEDTKKPLSFPQRVLRFFRILWFQYQIASATYMMEDWEARIYSILVGVW